MNVKSVGFGVAYFFGAVRYSALVLPVGIGAFLSGWVWLTWVTLSLIGLAVAAELVTSGAMAVHHVGHRRMEDELFAQMWADAERHANGGWVGLDGSEGTGKEDGPEGEAPVPTPQG